MLVGMVIFIHYFGWGYCFPLLLQERGLLRVDLFCVIIGDIIGGINLYMQEQEIMKKQSVLENNVEHIKETVDKMGDSWEKHWDKIEDKFDKIESLIHKIELNKVDILQMDILRKEVAQHHEFTSEVIKDMATRNTKLEGKIITYNVYMKILGVIGLASLISIVEDLFKRIYG